ncbi:MAG: hypothetical protein JSR58_05000 [Verrucomicrobia bacterium]|nr:hypothetical protein [Verrucomicrobiota bacterium]
MIYLVFVFLTMFVFPLSAECPCKRAAQPVSPLFQDELQAGMHWIKKPGMTGDMLAGALKMNFPAYGIIAREENAWDKEKVWVITQEEDALLMGFVSQGRAVLGICYFPASDILYWAVQGQGAYVRRGKESAKRLFVAEASRLEMLKMLDSKESPAVKMFRLLEGSYNLYSSSQPEELKNFVVGEILLREAGGIVTDERGRPIEYHLRSSGIVVASSNPFLHQRFLKEKQP